jgi:hypothetical protein
VELLEKMPPVLGAKGGYDQRAREVLHTQGSERGLAAGAKTGHWSGHTWRERHSSQESGGEGLSQGSGLRFMRRMSWRMTGEATNDWG